MFYGSSTQATERPIARQQLGTFQARGRNEGDLPEKGFTNCRWPIGIFTAITRIYRESDIPFSGKKKNMPCWGLGVRGHSHSRTLKRGEKSLSRSRGSCIILSIWNGNFLFWRKSHIPPTAWSTSHFSPSCPLTSLPAHEPDGIHWNLKAQIQKRCLRAAGKMDGASCPARLHH